MIKVENTNGNIEFDEMEIIKFIEEQVKLVPGVMFFKRKSVFKAIRETLKLSTGKVKISQTNPGTIFITLTIAMSKDVNFINMDQEIYSVLEYSLQKKYGLQINNLEIKIERLI